MKKYQQRAKKLPFPLVMIWEIQKYKIELLWYIGKCDVRRFGQLRRQIGEITESSLSKQLRELETDGFILRHDFCEVPPRVEYTLTELGDSFLSVLDCMKAWGDENLPT